MNILVVGGAGYIGSHTLKALKQSGHNPVVFDNLSTGRKESVLDNKLVVGDLEDKALLSQALKENKIDAVLHFAAKIDVFESIKNPYLYIKNNCIDGLNLIEAMLENNVSNIIFSSTAAVYGQTEQMPITEISQTKPFNPYGLSKLMFEKALGCYEVKGLKYVILRYFNACGADIDGQLGGSSNKKDLITAAINASLGKKDKLKLFGIDYETPDGTCIRDYIHVMDLADAHVKALEYLNKGEKSQIFNLGQGNGYSNREVIEAVKKITKADFEVEEVQRREGDIIKSIASYEKARNYFGWEPKHSDLETIIKTSYKWHKS